MHAPIVLIFCACSCMCRDRLYLSPYDLSPTYKDVHNKYSVRYFLNLVLVDEEDRRCVRVLGCSHDEPLQSQLVIAVTMSYCSCNWSLQSRWVTAVAMSHCSHDESLQSR
eukprot:scaffold4139_cov22-Tisochrysis_lutea.AAC.1